MGRPSMHSLAGFVNPTHCELHRRRLYLALGCSSLFDYATRELGYSEAAAWRRIKAMRLCGEVDSSARQALVEQAAGKSTRQVEKLLAGVDRS